MSATPLLNYRLSQEQYDRDYGASDRLSAQSMADRLTRGAPEGGSSPVIPKARILGYNDSTKQLLRESGASSDEWIEVPCAAMVDSMAFVMKRVERIIRVPMHHWVLAGNGSVYSPGQLVGSIDQFGGNADVELYILTQDDLALYAANELETQTWKYLQTPDPSSEDLPADPRERAMALFHLIKPVESNHWPAYITHRAKAEEIMDERMAEMSGEDVDTFLGHVKDELEWALTGVLEEEQWKAVADGVVVMGAEVSGDGFGEVRDADVMTRIHSPHQPQSVDVHFQYHHRTRWSSVEWSYTLGYRINSSPVAPLVRYSGPQKHTRDGWRSFGWFYLDDHRSEHSVCSIKRTDLESIHSALFGSMDTSIGDDISLTKVAKLLLAGVGIGFEVAEDNKSKDASDGFVRPFFDLDAQKPGISAAHLRRICSIKPLRGDDRADLSREQVTAPLD